MEQYSKWVYDILQTTQLLYERITDEDIDELSNKEKATYVIYSRMTTVEFFLFTECHSGGYQ